MSKKSNYRKKKLSLPKDKEKQEEEAYNSEEMTFMSHIKRRRRFSAEEARMLEQEYNVNANPSQERLQDIANQIGTARKIITTWFQNRRAKHKRYEKKQSDQSPVEQNMFYWVPPCYYYYYYDYYDIPLDQAYFTFMEEEKPYVSAPLTPSLDLMDPPLYVDPSELVLNHSSQENQY